ncbi:MAG: sugar ABC transporter permease [Clostridiales bacterium]|jgi:ABC-type sugar transport system permease subunit|nr:sugar ABC transporter permease [Clostridiales bacterium]
MDHITLNKQKKFSKSRMRSLIFCLCVIAVPTVQFGIFYIGVNINSLIMAFQSYEIDPQTNIGLYAFSGFDNFKTIWTELRYGNELPTALRNSFVLFLCKVGVGTTLALFFSLYIFKKKFLSKTFRVILFAPSILPAIVTVTMYRYFVDVAVPGMFVKMNGMGLLSNFDTRMATLVFYALWISFGTQILMYSGSMNAIDISIMEAAKLDGCNAFQEFFHIVFKLIWPTFVTFMVTNMAAFFIDQMNLFSFYAATADTRYITLGYMLFRDTRNSNVTLAEFPRLAAYSIVLTCIAAPITIGTRKLLEKLGPRSV